ncbi:MAG: ATP-binding protein [Chitinophagales bacterium]|nr:ATP-binding protein [Chitinophagales bacterium]MDW8419729.1 ATP-binding protein [Chitinophagales bacterium]
MLTKFYQRIARFVNHDELTARVLFFIVSVGFGLFALYGDNKPLIGPIRHEWINAFDSFVALVFFLLLQFFPATRKHYQQFGYALIYILNIGNIYLLYTTRFDVQYSYQFIVVFCISGWFFRKEAAYLYFFVIINVLLILVLLLAQKNSPPTFDFYATYLISAFAQFILLRYRFNIEDKLTESERKYRLLAENSFDLICIHNAKGELEFISPSIKRLLGYEPEDLIGHRPYEIVHNEDKPLIRSLVLNDPNHPSTQNPIQFRLRHKDGTYVWVETVFVPLESPDGASSVVLSQTRDIRKNKEYQLQLEERSKELERSNADLETFAFVSSHDMQEPLRMITNYMQLLRRKYAGKLDKEAEEYIEYANSGAANLQQLLRDLLSYSRITSSEIKCEEIDLNRLIADVLRNNQLEIKEKGAKILTENLCTVYSDRNLLMLVMQNLILNGIKYNHAEVPQVVISCKDIGTAVEFCVADNGIGIKPEHQKRIFEPFHRLHTKAEIPGTGLGLSICKKIVERMGGNIRLESEIGKGARFYFTLPK